MDVLTKLLLFQINRGGIQIKKSNSINWNADYQLSSITDKLLSTNWCQKPKVSPGGDFRSELKSTWRSTTQSTTKRSNGVQAYVLNTEQPIDTAASAHRSEGPP